MVKPAKSLLPDDRYFDPDPAQKEIAFSLYHEVARAPLVCPHGHVDARMFADPDFDFGTPTDLLLIPDHYVFRMLYSQGIPLEQLAVPARDGTGRNQFTIR
jgi:glucuronate isomerase